MESLLESAVVVMMAVLMVLGGTAKALEHFKSNFNQDHIIYKIMDFIQKILDFATANNKHDK
jgi:N-acetylglucosamine kinase-like BadF-type ATPase